MEYTIEMLTVVETPSYLKAAEALFSEAERESIVAMGATDPSSDHRAYGPRHKSNSD